MRIVKARLFDRDSDDYITVNLEVAETAEQKVKGLSNRFHIPYGTGMLFKPACRLWMRDTYEPLEASYVKDGVIIDIIGMEVVGEGEEPEVFGDNVGAADYVIETPEGFLDTGHVRVGSKVELLGEI